MTLTPLNSELILSFMESSIHHMSENLKRIGLCLRDLSDDVIWERHNASSNSIGNLILHLNGNITQYILSALVGIKDDRNRDAEFNLTSRIPKADLIIKHREVVEKAISAIREIDLNELQKIRMVQGFRKDGMAIIIHVVEHYSYHTGQIAFATKIIQNKDLGFYRGINLNVRNEGNW